MNILAAIALTILPTLLMYLILPKIGIRITSMYLRIAFAWFVGLYLTTFMTLGFAILYSTFTSSLLLKATFTSIILINIALFFFLSDLLKLGETMYKSFREKTFFHSKDVVMLIVFFLFSWLFFQPHLAMNDNIISRSPIYWDFHWHAAVIQSFAEGDNFPPENESYAGVPMTYHFFGDFVMAMYAAIGIDFVTAITFVSILSFFFVLITIVGFAEELFHSKNAGFIAAILTITSSSGHFTYYFQELQDQSIFQVIGSILGNSQHPWNISFISGNPSGYNGTMFNLFYFLEERHMIFGIVYLLLCLWIIDKRDTFSSKVLLILGLGMGAYFLWHVYITIMVLCALLFVLLIDSKRKQTLLLLGGFTIMFAAHYFYLKQVVTSEWFYPQAKGYPKLNFGFAAVRDTDGGTPLLVDMFDYYRFAYGFKIVLLPISLIVIWLHNRRLGIVLSSIIIPTFLLINSIQLTEHGGVAENHKWIRPMNIVVDLATAYLMYLIFFKKRQIHLGMLGLICMFFITISGIIELMPFLNSKPTVFHATYPSTFTTAIIQNSTPRDVFLSNYGNEIHLTGRKLFIGNSAGPNDSMNKTKRQAVVDSVYAANTRQTFCALTTNYNIDFVEIPKEFPSYLAKESKTTFTTTTENNESVTFIVQKRTCQ